MFNFDRVVRVFNSEKLFSSYGTGAYTQTQASDYYPFGMAHTVEISSVKNGKAMEAVRAEPRETDESKTFTRSNAYLYNGKEEQPMPGKWLDYGARFYDTQLGRWHSVDPLGELIQNFTPYNYSINNPVRFIDPDGMVITEGGGTDPTKLYGKQIDMNQASSGGRNAAGYTRNGPWFWKQMLARHPEMFDEANVMRINANRAPHINETWIKFNPSHAGYKGKLIHHHINQGNMATGIPEQAHLSMNSQLHRFLGKAGRGSLNMIAVSLVAFDFFNENPHSIGSMMETRKVDKLYFDQESNNYFEITSKTINTDNDGNEVSATITMNIYSNYAYDDDIDKYVGVGKRTTVTTTVYKGEEAKKMFLKLRNNGYI